MRTKGYKCYNIKCGACVGKTLCGLSGDEALTCEDRMVNQKTNADRIRAMSDEGLAEHIDCPYYINPEMCLNDANCYDCKLEWLQQPVKEDA